MTDSNPIDLEAKRLIKAGKKTTQAPPPGDNGPDNRPVIILEPGKLHEAAEQSEDALIASGAPICQRDGTLVKVVGLDRQTKGIHRPKGAPQIVAVESSHLAALLSSSAQYFKPRRSKDEETRHTPTDPPARLADAILVDPEPKAPHLVAFIESPIIAPDGRLYDKPGYLPELQLLLTGQPDNWNPPKRAALRDEAEAGLGLA